MPLKSHRVMVIGPSGAGKTTLLKALGISDASHCKTEAICYSSNAVDTPGEFFEIPRFYHALITSATKASLVLLVADPTRHVRFPSMFTKAIRTRSIGVVTKSDLADKELVSRAEAELRKAGVSEVFLVSSVTGQGLDLLRQRILGEPGSIPTT
jgi:ethanolamine utilization protein EutP